jgi:hypothetical protein
MPSKGLGQLDILDQEDQAAFVPLVDQERVGDWVDWIAG